LNDIFGVGTTGSFDDNYVQPQNSCALKDIPLSGSGTGAKTASASRLGAFHHPFQSDRGYILGLHQQLQDDDNGLNSPFEDLRIIDQPLQERQTDWNRVFAVGTPGGVDDYFLQPHELCELPGQRLSEGTIGQETDSVPKCASFDHPVHLAGVQHQPQDVNTGLNSVFNVSRIIYQLLQGEQRGLNNFFGSVLRG
jgi:hypothetical protein